MIEKRLLLIARHSIAPGAFFTLSAPAVSRRLGRAATGVALRTPSSAHTVISYFVIHICNKH